MSFTGWFGAASRFSAACRLPPSIAWRSRSASKRSATRSVRHPELEQEMRVGINGMGRMGRLALRAAMGAVRRADDDPRAGNRLDVVHLNEIKGGAAAIAHLLEFD